MKESWFESLDTSVAPTRNADGSINMHGLLLLTAEGLAATDAGARGSAWGQPEAAKATIWVVGDSTVSAFDDAIICRVKATVRRLRTTSTQMSTIWLSPVRPARTLPA